MPMKEHVHLMAEYNQHMNQKIYDAAESLTPVQLHENRSAFFGSVFATLNHIAVGDTIWLKRLASGLPNQTAFHPIADLWWPESLTTILCGDIQALRARRVLLDDVLLNLSASLSEAELSQSISYKNMKGDDFSKNVFSLLMHVFNHQTHHRGQVTTLLSQLGVDIGATDLVVLIPDA